MLGIVRLILCLALCLGIGATGAYFTAKGIPVWYAGLAKPAWTPPNIAFPIVWNILYALMAVSLFLLWQRTPAGDARTRAIALFFVQLALNAAWSPVFFTLHWVWSALGIIAALAIAILLTIRTAWPVNRPAAILLLPYLAWVLYASTLNAGVGVLNRGAG